MAEKNVFFFQKMSQKSLQPQTDRKNGHVSHWCQSLAVAQLEQTLSLQLCTMEEKYDIKTMLI